MNDRETRRTSRGFRVDNETSRRMGKIRQKGTDPEIAVRSLLTGLGARYRLNNRDLPGSPDIANRSKGWAVFVHGCFWHRHERCSKATNPKRNRELWQKKFEANKARDRRALNELDEMGFDTEVVWECELDQPLMVRERLEDLVESGNAHGNSSPG